MAGAVALDADALASLVAPRAGLKFNAFQSRVLAVLGAGVREVWCFAGNRSGKTRLGAVWSIAGALSDAPAAVTWVCCESSKVQREATQPPVLAYLADHEIRRDRHGRREINRFSDKIDRIGTAGGVLQFRNYCDGPESARGSSIRRAWLDEFTDGLDYYREVSRAVLDTGGRLLATLTAVDGLTPLLFHILNERSPAVVPVGTAPDAAARLAAGHDIAAVYGSMRENAENLPPGSIEGYERTLDPWEREVRINGRVLPLGGRPYVPGAVLAGIATVDAGRAAFAGLDAEVYEPPDAGALYVVGLDAAEGVGRDRGALVVLRVGYEKPDRVAAVIVADAGPEALAAGAVALARHYRGREREALIAPEANGPGVAVIGRLVDAGARVMLRPGAEDAVPGEPVRLGFMTGARSRDVLLSGLRERLVAGALVLRSRTLLDGLGTFVWNERRPEAAPGFYDDSVFALALAVFAARMAPRSPAPFAPPPPNTPAAHLADLRRKGRK